MGLTSKWWSLNQVMVNTEKDNPGVYELGDSLERVVYIGSSNEVKRRLGEHVNAPVYDCIGERARHYRIELCLLFIHPRVPNLIDLRSRPVPKLGSFEIDHKSEA